MYVEQFLVPLQRNEKFHFNPKSKHRFAFLSVVALYFRICQTIMTHYSRENFLYFFLWSINAIKSNLLGGAVGIILGVFIASEYDGGLSGCIAL